MTGRKYMGLLLALALCLAGCIRSPLPTSLSVDPVASLKADIDFFTLRADPYANLPPEEQPLGYTYLTDNQQILYRLLEEITFEPVENGNLDASFSQDDMDRVFTAFFFDHYETRLFHQLYRFTTHLYNNQPIYTAFALEPNPRDLTALYAEMDAAADKILEGMPGDANDYQKVRYLCDALADHIEYNQAAIPESEDYQPTEENEMCAYAYGALVNHSAICDGYAQAFAYVGKKAGLDIVTVFGTADNGEMTEPHAWNKVKLDGEYYAVDLTWYDMDTLRNKVYLLAADSEMADSHFEEDGPDYYGEVYFLFPAAQGQTYNALRQEGLCFSSSGAALSALTSLLSQGRRFVQLKFESAALLEETADLIRAHYDSEVKLPRLADGLWCNITETHQPSCTLTIQRVDVTFVTVYDEPPIDAAA